VPLGHPLHGPAALRGIGQLGDLLGVLVLGVGDQSVRAGQGGRQRLPGHHRGDHGARGALGGRLGAGQVERPPLRQRLGVADLGTRLDHGVAGRVLLRLARTEHRPKPEHAIHETSSAPSGRFAPHHCASARGRTR
jgi:hypothetical protein